MLTHTFGLSQWQEAFFTIADQEHTGAIKVAIDRKLTGSASARTSAARSNR